MLMHSVNEIAWPIQLNCFAHFVLWLICSEKKNIIQCRQREKMWKCTHTTYIAVYPKVVTGVPNKWNFYSKRRNEMKYLYLYSYISRARNINIETYYSMSVERVDCTALFMLTLTVCLSPNSISFLKIWRADKLILIHVGQLLPSSTTFDESIRMNQTYYTHTHIDDQLLGSCHIVHLLDVQHIYYVSVGPRRKIKQIYKKMLDFSSGIPVFFVHPRTLLLRA